MNQNLLGMSMDTRLQKQPAGTYFFGKNGIQNLYKGTPQNEPGFTKYSAVAPGRIIGIVMTDSKPVLFSVINGVSHIGYFNTTADTYEIILNDSTWAKKLNFKESNYIVGEYQRNFKNEIIVAFTDKAEEFRLLNCDNPRADSADDLQFFLRFTAPTIDADVITGGTIKKGAYFISLKYIKDDGSATPYTVTYGPLYVSDNTDGDSSNKALSIHLTNLDQDFRQYTIAIISKIKENYVVQELEPVDIVAGSSNLLYTGTNTSTIIALEEILVQPPVYKTVGTLGQLNDSLYLGDLESYPEIVLQRYANMVKVRVRSELFDARQGVTQSDHTLGKKKHLMHQEVYALFIRFHKTAGGYTKGYLIPGQDSIPADLADDAIAAANGINEAKFRIGDTNRDPIGTSCSTGTWINETEVFPNTPEFDSSAIGGEDLRGKPVRHHKMPSLAYCKNTFYSLNDDYGRGSLDILGLEISNVIIPAANSRDIDGWEILIAKRSLSNSQVIAQTLLVPAAHSNDNTKLVSTGGNWRSVVMSFGFGNGPGNYSFPEALQLDKSKFRTHPFDVLYNKPAIAPQYVAPQLKVRALKLDEHYPTGGLVDDGISVPLSINTPFTVLSDYTTQAAPPVVPANNQRYRKVTKSKYLPNNVNLGEWNSIDIETSFSVELDNTLDMASTDLAIYPADRSHSIPFEETMLVNLLSIKRSLYENFYSQDLIPSGQFKTLSAAPQLVYPGDSFISDYTYHTYGWYNGNESYPNVADRPGPREKTFTKVIRRVICETASNVNMRFETTGNIYSKWYPKTPITYGIGETGGIEGINDFDDEYIRSFNRALDPNQFGYDKSLNALNELGGATNFNPFNDADMTTFPDRIHRTGKLPRQGLLRSWRTILPLDYYELQKNRGKIIRIVPFGDRLLIHTENGLFITESKGRLEAGTLSVTLGSGDIFEFEPKEPIDTKLGYAGLQHELAAIQTPIGYVFPDVRQKQLFLFNGKLELINPGIDTFLRSYMTLKDNNPYIGNGITLGWDPEFTRLLVTVKNIKTPTSVKLFVDTPEFWAGLQVNDLISYKGKIVTYKGVNNTSYNCHIPDVITWVAQGATCRQLTGSNTGELYYATRARLTNGVLDGYTEPNDQFGGKGPYFPPIQDLTTCPLPAAVISWVGSGAQCMRKIPATEYCLNTSVNNTYTDMFTRIYKPGFSNYSIGQSVAPSSDVEVELTTAHIWRNTDLNTTDGPANRMGVWTADCQTGIIAPPTVNTVVTAELTYNNTYIQRQVYVGVFGDNEFKLIVNGTVIAETDGTSNTNNFKIYHLFPATLIVGKNTFKVIGIGQAGPADTIGCVVYDNTLSQLTSAVTFADLAELVTTSSLRYDVNPGQIAAHGCPTGWELTLTNGVYSCQKVPDSSGTNTGLVVYSTRCRLSNGVPDGFCEANATGTNYVPPKIDETVCPTTPVQVTGLGCDSNVTERFSGTGAHDYTIREIGVQGRDVQIEWTNDSRPTKYTIFEDDVLLITTGWIGVANYSGAWGTSLNPGLADQSFSGSMRYSPQAGHVYTIKVETGGASTDNLITHIYNYKVKCI